MSEIAEYLGQRIKIGTCEDMYYLRYDDRHKVQALPHNVDPGDDRGLRFRLPFPDEDMIEPGDYTPHNRGERLYKDREKPDGWPTDFEPDHSDDPGTIQLTHPCGLLLNVKCYHGGKLPGETPELKPFWNGRSWFYELSAIKVHDDGKIYPVVKCRYCGHAWRYTWDEILPYLHGEMLERLKVYA